MILCCFERVYRNNIVLLLSVVVACPAIPVYVPDILFSYPPAQNRFAIPGVVVFHSSSSVPQS
jgi:hypothetical protein